MNQCEKCSCFGPCMKSDVEIVGFSVKGTPTCIAYPDGIPEEFITDNIPCKFHIDD